MKLKLLLLMSLSSQIAFGADKPKSEDEKTLYALGQLSGRNLGGFKLTKKEAQFVLLGIEDMISKQKEKVELKVYGPKVRDWVQKRQLKVAADTKKAGKAFLDKAAGEKGVKKTPSGLLYKIVKDGKGKNPTATDRVKVHYHGTLTDGTVFDSSVERGEPISFGLNQVIKCWTEGMQKVKKGGKIKLWCPSDIAYGDRGSPPKIDPGATLVFEVELLDIEAAKPAPHAHKKTK